jgi:hypothetical protein
MSNPDWYAEYRDGVIVALNKVDQGEGQAHTPVSADHPDVAAYFATAEENALNSMEVTPLQLRRALRKLGALNAVLAYVASQSAEVQEAWEYAVKMPASDPMIKAACAALGVERKALFDLAATF